MLNVEGEFALTLVRANHANLFFRRNGVTKLEPDVRIIKRDLGEADGSTMDTLLDFVDWNADGRIAVHPVGIKTRSSIAGWNMSVYRLSKRPPSNG